jgi:hypothetical protein
VAAGQAGIEGVGEAGQSSRKAAAATVVVKRLRSRKRTPYRWKNPGLKTRNKSDKRIPSIFKDESTGSIICLRSLIYMLHA